MEEEVVVVDVFKQDLKNEKSSVSRFVLFGNEYQIINELQKTGMVLIDKGHTERQLAKWFRTFSNVLLITPVRIIKKPDAPTLFNFTRMHLHTDTPCADIVAWHCCIEGLTDELTVLLDSSQVISALPISVLQTLSKVKCEVPNRDKVPTKLHMAYEDYPLLRKLPDQTYAVNYTPYLKFIIEDEEQKEAVKYFQKTINEHEKYSVKLHLELGQSLIVDNRRYLHCRTDLHKDSPRCHYRYLLASY